MASWREILFGVRGGPGPAGPAGPMGPPGPAGDGFKHIVPQGGYLVFYVAKGGNDANDGLSPETAFLTINHAAWYVSKNVWVPSTGLVGVSIGDGVYDETIHLGNIAGGGYGTFSGNNADLSAVKISPTTNPFGACVVQYGSGSWTMSGIHFECTVNGQLGLISSYGGGGSVMTYSVRFGTNVNGPIAYCHPGGAQGRILLQGFEVVGTSSYLAICDTDGYVENSHGHNTITVDPGWVAVYRIARFGRVYDASTHNMNWSNPGGYAGMKYQISPSGRLHSTRVDGIPGSPGICDPGGIVTSDT